MNVEIVNHLSDAEIVFNSIVLGICGLMALGVFAVLIALAASEWRKK